MMQGSRCSVWSETRESGRDKGARVKFETDTANCGEMAR